MMEGMRTTKEGIDLIREFESCALTAYRDQNGIWTIGWGRTEGVKEGDTCDQAQADAWLLEAISFFELLVVHCIGSVRLTDNQLSALVSFAYNVGTGREGVKDGFMVLKAGGPSTLLKCILAKDFAAAAAEFPKWDKSGGAPCRGIFRRRKAEQALFLTPDGVAVASRSEV